MTLLGMVLVTAAICGISAGLWALEGMARQLTEGPTVLYLAPPAVPWGTRSLETPWRPEMAMPPAAPQAQPATPAQRLTASPTEPSKPSYVIQVALFGSLHRASVLLGELTQAGYRAYRTEAFFGSSGPLQQVLVGPYATRAEAELDRDRIHQIPGYGDARVAASPGRCLPFPRQTRQPAALA